MNYIRISVNILQFYPLISDALKLTQGLLEFNLTQNVKLKPAVKIEQKPKELSMYEQIQNVKLAKVVKDPTRAPKIITKNERNFLQNALSTAIKMRKMNLQKHEEEDEDSDDSDW